MTTAEQNAIKMIRATLQKELDGAEKRRILQSKRQNHCEETYHCGRAQATEFAIWQIDALLARV